MSRKRRCYEVQTSKGPVRASFDRPPTKEDLAGIEALTVAALKEWDRLVQERFWGWIADCAPNKDAK